MKQQKFCFNVWYNLFTGSCPSNEKNEKNKPNPSIHWKLAKM